MNLLRPQKMRKNGTEERNNSNFNEKERNRLINQNVITNPMRRNKNKDSERSKKVIKLINLRKKRKANEASQ